ncbi:hypothetical protein TNCV_2145221 [Trichonephila clavipes]|uniref:Uncharacterized protein n=1 Tax=Trichonephila clavipes TaxID=2585209 RepID=A0A8X6STP9_TRICX|nr:hypothetical protein TNCV_2145221 [Trichonephila clavipes]
MLSSQRAEDDKDDTALPVMCVAYSFEFTHFNSEHVFRAQTTSAVDAYDILDLEFCFDTYLYADYRFAKLQRHHEYPYWWFLEIIFRGILFPMSALFSITILGQSHLLLVDQARRASE